MKLINCNVENFGTLQNYKINFNEGLTVLHEQNGFGKSTLAVFIKSMFYGLPVVTKRSLDENERKKYTPWQKGVFGGSLDFEFEGKKYRIERFFGDKEKDDTVKVYDLDYGCEYSGFGENIGLSLFGIDAESFERSVYMPQRNTALKMNSSLSAKLTGLVENSDDISNFDKALKALNDRAKQYMSARGVGGMIAGKEREIEVLYSAVTDGKVSAENYNRLKTEIETLKQTHSQLTLTQKQIREKITAVSDMVARQTEAKQYKELNDTLSNAEEELKEIEVKYPEGLPNSSEIIEIEENIRVLNRAETELSVLKNDIADRDELDSLLKKFGEELPTEQEISAVKSKLRRLDELKIKEETINERLKTANAVQQSGSKLPKLLIAAAVLLVLAGVVTLIWQLAVGIAVLCLGIVLLGASAFAYLKNMITANDRGENPGELLAEQKRLTAEIETLSHEVMEFIEKFKSEAEPYEILEQLSNAQRDIERLKKTVAKQDCDITVCSEKVAEIKGVLDKFFRKYGQLDGDYSILLDSVKTDIRQAVIIKNELKTLRQKLAELPEIKEIPKTVEIANREELLAEEKRIGLELNSVMDEITRKENEAGRLLADVELLTENEDQLENSKQELVELQGRYNVIVTAARLLEKAKNDLSLRYVDRMKKDFGKYSEILGAEFDDTMLDSDLNLKIKDSGASRVRESYSEGFRDMMDIAMRLSLSDAMFDGQEVMLILDDPFVNLDDIRLKNAMSLLKKLSENRQIIYLTCHSSRVL